MTNEQEYAFPKEAYAPDGTLWWRLETWPDSHRPFGDERKLAAWMTFNLEVGDTFTIRDLRMVWGSEAEHFNRRLRRLRPDGWELASARDDGSLAADEYRLRAKGWHPGQVEDRPVRSGVSQGVRRRVFDRDGRRCVVCGVGSGEPYPGEPRSKAVLTVGHRIPGARNGSSRDLSNLQTECGRCNEPVRDEMSPKERLADLLPEIRLMGRSEKSKLESWLLEGRRTRDRTDEMYDRLRTLGHAERAEAEIELRRMLANT
jgi:hypothetical protein